MMKFTSYECGPHPMSIHMHDKRSQVILFFYMLLILLLCTTVKETGQGRPGTEATILAPDCSTQTKESQLMTHSDQSSPHTYTE